MKEFNNFDEFRTWFNRNFKLSFKGKFCGLLRLVESGIFDLFVHKLRKMLRRDKRRRPIGDVLSMSINHLSIKLYVC